MTAAKNEKVDRTILDRHFEQAARCFDDRLAHRVAGELGLCLQRARHELVARIVAAYDQAFADIEWIRTPTERPGYTSAQHLYPLRVSSNRDATIDYLSERGIGASVHFIPIHLHPYYRDKYGFRPEDFPVAYGAYEGLISLPLHSGLADEDVQAVIAAVRASVPAGVH